MKIYLLSIAAGLLVGVIYGALGVRSPAPPVVALLGLLGILVGEQLAFAVRRHVEGKPVNTAWVASECVPKITGVPAAVPSVIASERAAEPGDRSS